MANVLETTVKIWERFAKFVLSLSFRYVCLVFAFLFCLFPGNLSYTSVADRVLLAGLSRISGLQVGPAEIGIVTVPNDMVREWEADFYNADELSSLLSNILHSSSASVGLLLDSPLDSHTTVMDQRLSLEASSDAVAQQILEKKRYLNELLADPRVVLGARAEPRDTMPALELGIHSDFPIDIQAVKNWYQDCALCANDLRREIDGDWFPVVNIGSLQDYLWLPSDGAYSSSFLSALILNKQALAVTDGKPALTKPPSVFASYISGGPHLIPMQPFVAAYKTSESFTPNIISLSLEEALLVNAFPSYVLIASQENMSLAQDKAAALYSLMNQRTFSIAWWLEPLSRVAILLFLTYLAFLHFRIKARQNRLLALGFLCSSQVIVATVLALNFKLWLPLTSLMFYSAVVLLLMNLWWFQRQRHAVIDRELTDAIDSAGKYLEANEQYAEAMSLFAHYPEKKLGIEKICRIANKMEDKKLPLQQVITAVDSLLPLVDHDAQLKNKLALLKQTQATRADLKATQPREPSRIEDIPKSLGRYQIQKEIGRGAVGVVYLGFDPAISRKVAIKTLDARQFSKDQHENLQARFFREAEAAGRLNHPNIVSVFDVGEEGDLAYIAMDYVEGMPLSDCIKKTNLLPISAVFRAMHDVAVALSYAHENQIVHRDIKPGNIMYSAEPYTLKVADFGIARLLDNSKTSTGEILGSPLYMAPEQLKGSKVGPTADIFSLGVTFYQLLSAELPFNADNLASLTYEIIHTKHKNIRTLRKDLPASAARIVNQCLQKRPDDRYESALELAGVLRKAIRRDFPAEAKRWGMI